MLESLHRLAERHGGGWIQIARTEEEVQEQCWDCRVVGSIALYGTSALSWRCFLQSKRSDLGNRIFFGAMGGVFLLLGTYRAVTPTTPARLPQHQVDHTGNPRRIEVESAAPVRSEAHRIDGES